MKIELKKISFYERMSEETNCFAADLYINGKKVGECKNDGQGGCTDYNGYSKENNEIIRQAEDYFKSLPKVKIEGLNFMHQPTLESAIDEQLEAYLKAKFEAKAQKKFEKLQQTSIVWGKPNTYGQMHLPFSIALSHVAKVQPQKLQERIDAIKTKYCTGDVVILNTNLKALGLTV
jgi:hypothetical protein